MCTCCPALRASHSSAQRLTLPAVWLPPSGGLATPATGTCQPAPPACKLRPPFGILHSLVLPNVNCGAGVAVGRALTPRCVGPAALPPAAFIRAFISHPPRKQPVIYKCAGPTHRCGACISCPTCLAHERTVLAASPSRSPQFYPLPGRTCAAGACLPALLPSNAMSPPCVFSSRPPSSPPPLLWYLPYPNTKEPASYFLHTNSHRPPFCSSAAHVANSLPPAHCRGLQTRTANALLVTLPALHEPVPPPLFPLLSLSSAPICQRSARSSPGRSLAAGAPCTVVFHCI